MQGGRGKKLRGDAARGGEGGGARAGRVDVEGWAWRGGGEGGGVGVRGAREWVSRYGLEGEWGLWDGGLGRRCVAKGAGGEGVEGMVGLRGLGFAGVEIGEGLGVGLWRVWGMVRRWGMGGLGGVGVEKGRG